MKCIGLILFVVVGVALRADAAAKINNIVRACKCYGKTCSNNTGPYCFGFNKLQDGNDKCGSRVSTDNCTSSFASIIKVDDEKLTVRLAGKIGEKKKGWIGILFVDAMQDNIEKYQFGFVCLTHGSPKIQVLGPKFEVNNEGTHGSTLGEDFEEDPDHKEWMVCQFNLVVKPRPCKFPLEVTPVDYKIGLFLNKNNGKTMNAKGQIAKADSKTSSNNLLFLDVTIIPPFELDSGPKIVISLSVTVMSLLVSQVHNYN